ncbi:MAG: hypothetical protein MI922_24980 [Bacteroidales bacterium]|nr:hypothetical protein [Bacteroidales bacterium]
MKTLHILLFCLITISLPLKSQDEEYKQPKHELYGYVSAMPYLMHQSLGDTSITYMQDLVHNRLNFKWYPSNSITATVQLRTQFLHGDMIKESTYPDGLETEAYFMPLSLYWNATGNSVLYSSIDRLWVQYMAGNFEATIGRQRINWGQTFVYNPNDIFNSYNFFDFDYAEKPGADAIRLQYYTGFTSSLEIAAKIDSASNVTAAALFKFNKWNYDVQLLAGYYSSYTSNELFQYEETEDYVAGIGWSGDFFGMSFRGEMSYFQPVENFSDTSGLLVSSFALDYTFTNEMYASVEFLYQDIENASLSSFNDFYGGTRSSKNMSATKYNLVGQLTYPISPIINLSLAGMYFFQDDFDGFYAGPTLSISTTKNTELSVIYQFFGFKEPILTQDKWMSMHLAFARFRLSF